MLYLTIGGKTWLSCQPQVYTVSGWIPTKTTFASAFNPSWADAFLILRAEPLISTLTFEAIRPVTDKTGVTRAFIASLRVETHRISATSSIVGTFVYISTNSSRICLEARLALATKSSRTNTHLVFGTKIIMTLALEAVFTTTKVTRFTRAVKSTFSWMIEMILRL